MKKFKVVVTPDAKADLKSYLSYLRHKKKNPQAARNVLEDFRSTKNSLSDVAASLPDPENGELKSRGLKRNLKVDRSPDLLL